MKKPLFVGSGTAIVTPLTPNGSLDLSALKRLVTRQIENGTSAIIACGTTGEAATLSDSEFSLVVSTCATESSGRVPIIAGAGLNSTAATLNRAILAEESGADGLLLVNPYYNKSTQGGLIAHFNYIADRVSKPILLYNVPSRTGMSFTAKTYCALAAHPLIYGVKEASGDFSLVTRTRALCPPDFSIYSGNDDHTVAMMAMGALGVITTVGNLTPYEMTRTCALFENGDAAAAAAELCKISPLIDALFCETNPMPLKYAMERLGLCSGTLRLPLIECGEAAQKQVDTALRGLSLLAPEQEPDARPSSCGC